MHHPLPTKGSRAKARNTRRGRRKLLCGFLLFWRMRGRTGFELRPDQSLVEIGIGPTDRVEESPGKWKLERGNQLLFYSQSSPEPTRTMQIVSVDDDHLVIKK